MIDLTTSKARQDFRSVLHGVKKGERYVLSRHKKKVAAIVSVEDLELLQFIEDQMDAKAARDALEEIAQNGTLSLAQVKGELGI